MEEDTDWDIEAETDLDVEMLRPIDFD